MKRLSLVIVLVCCAMGMAAQVECNVKYQGAQPTISDFVQAMVSARHEAEEEDDCQDESFNAFNQAWEKHCKGVEQDEEDKLTVDQRNGYVVYESTYDGYLLRVDMCYWNEADKKHKLVAYNVRMYKDGKCDPGQFDGITFYRYNNATKKMTMCDAPGFDVMFRTEDGYWVSYDLPRTGKDITVTTWKDSGPKREVLKWNGRGFN